jgi:hypothetical protein
LLNEKYYQPNFEDEKLGEDEKLLYRSHHSTPLCVVYILRLKLSISYGTQYFCFHAIIAIFKQYILMLSHFVIDKRPFNSLFKQNIIPILHVT